jgi:magnesium/cobalt transport protein CorA
MPIRQVERPATDEGPRALPSARAYLYDANGSDRRVRLDRSVIEDLGDEELLWADVATGTDTVNRLPEWFGIEPADIEKTGPRTARPKLEASDRYFHLSAVIVAETSDGFEPAQLHCFVGRNWILTVHDDSFDLLGSFNRPIRGETEIGELDGPVFLATLLDWALTGYYRVLESLENRVDDLDERLLTQDVERDELLRKLVRLRRRITELRRLLTPNRDVLSILTQPDSHVFTASDSSAQFQRVYDRLEKAIGAVDNTREMVIGSFEVFMTQTAQRTNDIMKTLTLVSVLLLPSAVIAAVLGMNFRVDIFERSYLFWVTIAIMICLAGATLVIARRRRWI